MPSSSRTNTTTPAATSPTTHVGVFVCDVVSLDAKVGTATRVEVGFAERVVVSVEPGFAPIFDAVELVTAFAAGIVAEVEPILGRVCVCWVCVCFCARPGKSDRVEIVGWVAVIMVEMPFELEA